MNFEAQRMSEENQALDRSVGKPSRLVLFCVVNVFVVYGLFALQNRFWQYNAFNEGILSGAILGLSSVVAILGGLSCKNWLQGVWLATLLTAAVVLATAIEDSIDSEVSEGLTDALVGLFMVPTIVAIVSLPTLAMRLFFGWRLNPVGQKAVRESLTIESVLLFMAACAALLTLGRTPQIVWDMPISDFLEGLGMAVGLLGSTSCVVTLPGLWCHKQGRSLWIRWLLPACLVFIASTLTYGLFDMVFNNGDKWDILITSTTAGAITCSNLMLWLWVIGRSGYGIASADYASRDAEDNCVGAAVAQWNNRLWVAGTFICSVVAGVVSSSTLSGRLSEDQRFYELATRLKEVGGSVRLRDKEIFELNLGALATDDTLIEFKQFNQVLILGLAGSAVTDVGIAQIPTLFPNLISIDLGHTRITKHGLQSLSELKNLNACSFAGTGLSLSDINQFVSTLDQTSGFVASDASRLHQLQKLDLSDMRLGEVGLQELPDVESLVLKGNGLNDRDFQVLKDRSFRELNISDNPISGSGLPKNNVDRLIAHNVPLTDQAFAGFMAKASVKELEISNTQLTDAILPSLVRLHRLRIGDGLITEYGVSNSSLAFSVVIDFCSKQFVGDYLDQPQFGSSLCLANSGIRGANLRKLSGVPFLNSLDLSGTTLRDEDMESLKGIQVVAIDLSGTKVSAPGIVKSGIVASQIYVECGQFTPEELSFLRRYHNIIVGEDLPEYLR